MADLSSKEIKAFNQAVLELYQTRTTEDYPAQLYKALRLIIGGTLAAVDWVNPKSSISLACRLFSESEVSPELSAFANSLAPSQSPAWLQCVDEPRAISDFIDYAQWSRRDLHWVYQQSGQLDSIGLDVPLTDSLTVRVRDFRERFGRYAESERFKLKLLGPHIRQSYHRMKAQGHIGTGDRRTQGMQVNLGADGRACEWTADAQALLVAYGIHVANDDLPDTIKTWFLQQKHSLEQSAKVTSGAAPLTYRRGERKLSLYLLRRREPSPSYWLVMEETEASCDYDNLFPNLSVTRRESEVIFWLGQGKSNAEIAIILGVSPGTIGRHLENVFPKLGVENRFAASLMVTQALSAKARESYPS